jgi:hypothetical protein
MNYAPFIFAVSCVMSVVLVAGLVVLVMDRRKREKEAFKVPQLEPSLMPAVYDTNPDEGRIEPK